MIARYFTGPLTNYKFFLILVFSFFLSGCGSGSIVDTVTVVPGCGFGEVTVNPGDVPLTPPILSLKASYDTYGQTRGVLLDGNQVYVADGNTGLLVLRLNSFNALVKVGQLGLVGGASGGGSAYSLKKKGNYLFMAARSEGVHVINVTDPANPVLSNTITIPTPARATFLELVGNNLYVAADEKLVIVDITDPVNPVIKGSVLSNSLNQHLVVSDSYAYVAAYNKGFRIIDISNPDLPVVVVEFDVSLTVKSIEKKGDIIYLGAAEGKILSVNVADITTPRFLDIIDLPDTTNVGINELSPYHMIIRDGYMYVSDGDSGIQIVDIKNPEALIVEKGLDTSGNSWEISTEGRNMIVADEFSGVHFVDIFETNDSDGDHVQDGADAFPNNPFECLDTDGDGIGNNADLDDDNDTFLDLIDAFPFDVNEWLDTDSDSIGDNADVFPTNPTEWADKDLDGVGDNSDQVNQLSLSSFGGHDTTNGQTRGVLKDGSIIYVADGTAGLKVYELASGGSLNKIGAFFLAGEAQAAARTLLKVGNYLYLTARTEGLYVLDVSDPANPVLITRIDTPDMATFITKNGSYLYVSDRKSLIIFDISIPGSPVEVGGYPAPNEFEHVLVEDGIAYIAAYYSGLMLLDVSNPSAPTKITSVSAGFALWAIEKRGNYIFTGGETSGLIVFDVENPLNPIELVTLALPDQSEPLTTLDQPPFDMEAHGDYLFVADGDFGVQVVDISNPLAPFIATEFDTPGNVQDFYRDGQNLVVGDYVNGFHVLNIGPEFDLDADGIGNNLDVDIDGDAITNITDPRPLDTDNDGIDNDLDIDDDNDSVNDSDDMFALDEEEWLDANADGLGDNIPNNRFAVIDTSLGMMKLELLEDIAPLTTKNFIKLATSGFYDGLIFHRVINAFMIQGGDPNGNGTGGPGYAIADEFPVDYVNNLLAVHDAEGVLSMANSGPDTGGSQFFITLGQQSHLDGVHTVFGRIVQGLPVLQDIGAVETTIFERPIVDVVINSVTITLN